MSPSDPLGSCLKQEIASGNETASVSLNQLVSACSILAQIVYAEDRGRTIASAEEAIRLDGFCPGEFTGIGFPSGSGAEKSLPGMRTVQWSIPKPVRDWIVDKVKKALGKKVAKEVEKDINKCEMPKSLYKRIANFILDQITLGLLKACVAS